MSATTQQARLPAAFPIVGGKWRLAKRIVGLMPAHDIYVEPFTGAANVFFAKPRARIECLNDIDGDIVNFFRVLGDPAALRRLVDRLRLTPYSREEYERCCCTDPPSDPVGRAWRFYVLARQSFGGYRPANNGKAFSGSTRGRWRRSLRINKNEAAVWRDAPEALLDIAERLRGVFIENRDFRYVIARYDRPDTLFYLDPPYIGHEGYYDRNSFAPVRHVELGNVLNRIQGKAMVSYYPHPSLERLYPADRWRRVEFQATKNTQNVARGRKHERVTELVLCNFDA